MKRRPFKRTRFFVLLGLVALLAFLGWYFGNGGAVAGGQVVTLGL